MKCVGFSIGPVLSKTRIAGCPSTAPWEKCASQERHFGDYADRSSSHEAIARPSSFL
ncbi:hypothetical protein RGR602_PC02060 (plasmid) [Rhizobium gallicum bv. gallicum R602sp]|uniref:Uncharacterized protein n=1 Tax=Rhizobium gallicum bv. gallicum R602sp TaxID=1041138 RepID=A0A0B4XHL9_9HYPH|nr:hypothetical protein RGR602_PC02060 [Rhizobium gallicum bv. gallicum R602sp]